MRVSLNSVREPYYSRYYQPRGYSLDDIVRGIRVAKKAGKFVSINYLSFPGFTDSEGEYERSCFVWRRLRGFKISRSAG